MDSRKDVVNLTGVNAGSIPSSKDAKGFWAFLNDEEGRGFKSFGRKPSFQANLLNKPKSSPTNDEDIEVEDCGSSKGGEAPSALSSREKDIPSVPKFNTSASSVPQEHVFVPPFILDKTRSDFCAPEYVYGVTFNLVTPKDREFLRSKDMKDACEESMGMGYQMMPLFFSLPFLSFFCTFNRRFLTILIFCAEFCAYPTCHLSSRERLLQEG